MDDQANTKRLFSIGESSEYLGVSIDTLRRWEKKGRITPLRSPGGHRYYSKDDLDALFGKRYTRDEETQRRTAEEINGVSPPPPVVVPENINTQTPGPEQVLNPPNPTPPDESGKPTGIQPTGIGPNVGDTIGIPSWREAPINATPIPKPVTESILHPIAEVHKEETPQNKVTVSDIHTNPPPPNEVINTPTTNESKTDNIKEEKNETPSDSGSQIPDFPNILLPKKEEEINFPAKDENILTPEEIERRIGTIMRTEKKKNFTNIFLGIVLTVVLAADIYLLYIWATSSRILSPIP